KAEVGQGLRASLAQAIAEELRVPVAQVRVVLGDTARTPFDLGTFGSRTTPILAARLHRVAAAARELFLDRAAAQWGVARSTLSLTGGQVGHPSTGQAFSYYELAGDQPLAAAWDATAPVTAASEWTVAGHPVSRVGGEALVTGAHRYPA